MVSLIGLTDNTVAVGTITVGTIAVGAVSVTVRVG